MRPMGVLVAASVILESMFACASGGARAGNKCEPAGQEFAAYSPVYSACEVDRQAQMKSRPISNLGAEVFMATPSLTCYRAIIDVVVDEEGTPIVSSARVVRATSTPFAEAVVKQLEQARYTPAMKGTERVAQVVRYDIGAQTMKVVGGGIPSAPVHQQTC